MTKRHRSINHQPWRDWLPMYVAGSLPPQQRTAVEAHLAICAECRQLAEHWRQIAVAVQSEAVDRADHRPQLDRTLFTSHIEQSQRKPSMTTQNIMSQPYRARPLNLISLAALLIFVTALIGLMNRPPGSGSFGGHLSAVAQATAVASPTIEPTATALSAMAASILSGSGTLLSDDQPMSGHLSRQTELANYRYTSPESGLLAVNVESYDFKPHVIFLQLDSSPGANNESDPAQSADVTVYAHVQKGDRVGISVGSDTGSGSGDFTINAAVAQPIALTYNQPFAQQIVVPPDTPKNPAISNGFHYFSFDAKAGDVIDVRVKSDQNLDLTMYLQSYTLQPMTMPIFNSSVRSGCTESAYWQQCYDDDSGGGTDPEIKHLVVQEDRHFDVVVSGIGLFTQTANYQVTVSKSDPISLGANSQLNVSLSWKAPILPILLIAQKGQPISIQLAWINGAKYPFQLIAEQDGLGLGQTEVDFDPVTTLLSHVPFTFTPQSNDPVVLFVKYAKPPMDGTQSLVSIQH